MTFQKATKHQAKGRLALCGPSGSGKTYTALRVAQALKGEGRIALIDTEARSASKYAKDFDFDVKELSEFSPKSYVDAIHEAESLGHTVLIIDSLTHAWSGAGGVLEMHDDATRRDRSHNSYAAWRDVTPEHNSLVDAMVRSSTHIIGTMRSKTAHEMEKNDAGKLVVRKLGMKPIQRDGMEYEFDVVCDLDLELYATVGKTRCSELSQKVFHKAGENDLGKIFHDWLTDGAPALMGEGELRQMRDAIKARFLEIGETFHPDRRDQCGRDVVKSLGFEKSADMPVEMLSGALEAISKWEPEGGEG